MQQKGKQEKLKKIRDDPVLFANIVLGLHLFPYQEKLLRDNSIRIVSCMGRQSGKTTTIAVKAIHFSFSNPRVTVLITSPSLRQSMIMFDRILRFIFSSPTLPEALSAKHEPLFSYQTVPK